MTFKTSELNPSWAGDDVSYRAMHTRITQARGRACEHQCACGKTAHDWALRHDADPLDPASYDPMCRGCHLAYDRTGENNGHASRTKYARGEQHGQAKLNWEKVRQIRALRYTTTPADLAARFGVSPACILKVQRGKTWRPGTVLKTPAEQEERSRCEPS